MKTVLCALAALAIPGAALAQQTTPPASAPGAAATLPNTFDQPETARRAPAPAPRPPEPTDDLTQSDPADVAVAETALRNTIEAMLAGEPNYDEMTPDLAQRIRGMMPTMKPVFDGFGDLRAMTYVGSQNGAELFLVIFANTPTQWIIGQNDDGLINLLLFRPAPAPSGGAAPAPGA